MVAWSPPRVFWSSPHVAWSSPHVAWSSPRVASSSSGKRYSPEYLDEVIYCEADGVLTNEGHYRIWEVVNGGASPAVRVRPLENSLAPNPLNRTFALWHFKFYKKHPS